MATWYKGTLTYKKENENGKLLTIREAYLFDALSFTEAEARCAVMTPGTVQEVAVVAIQRMRYSDVLIREEQEKWYACKTVFHVIDERTGKSKKKTDMLLVQAAGITDALIYVQNEMNKWLVPVEIESVALTPYLDVFPYEKAEEQ